MHWMVGFNLIWLPFAANKVRENKIGIGVGLFLWENGKSEWGGHAAMATTMWIL